jgi:hypothetical protein
MLVFRVIVSTKFQLTTDRNRINLIPPVSNIVGRVLCNEQVRFNLVYSGIVGKSIVSGSLASYQLT